MSVLDFPPGAAMEKLQLLNLLSNEREAIMRALALIAYNPAIGRVLEKGGVDRFARLMVETIPKFYGYVTRDHFNAIHAETCEQIVASLKTWRGQTLSYGQAQKPFNVFLKVYVDWARRPEPQLAEKLVPFLHCPLDSLLMKFIKREFPQEYEAHVSMLRRRQVERVAERLKEKPHLVARSLGSEFSLVFMNRELYLAWQELLHSLYPAKPVALDLIWLHEHMRLRAKQGQLPK